MNASAASQLSEALSLRSQPLLIRIDENKCIVAAHWDYDSQHYAGIVFRHPSGPIDVGVDPPSNLEYYSQFINDFESLSVEQKREELINEVLGEDPVPDADNETFENWLSQQIDDLATEQWIEHADPTLGESAPGFLILQNLTKKEADNLGIKEVDLGGGRLFMPNGEIFG